jgi:hypothetical protein
MKCTYSKCYNVAEYNYKYYSKPAYCNKHKNDKMVTKSEICIIL